MDAALGAEEMVEHLSERNLAQEDKLEEMKETVETLEALHDMNEEIAENFRETELELKQELDLQAGQMRQVRWHFHVTLDPWCRARKRFV